MIILGIHDGHNSGASLFKNGKLLSAISEEKISRKKNEYGFPEKSIKFILKHNNIKKNQVNKIAVSTKFLPPKYFLVKRNTTFSLQDYIKEQNDFWFNKIYKKKKSNILKFLRIKF
jgi:carbamoyltransferase